AERDNVLKGIDLKNTVMDMAKQTIDEYVDKYINTKPRNYFKYMKALYSAFMPPDTILIPGMSEMTPEEIGQFTLDIVNNVYNLKLMMVGEEFFSHEQKEILLRVVDTYWVDHIDLMDQMRQSVGLVAVGQKDPVKEYTIEAYEMFKALNKKIRLETLKFVFSFEGME
ncbi:MAG: preprotein translocase subunit SecA, partial [Peptostreptococcus porci]|nr:preprotein translocase subunit SecA [Peptostreptococcus porci]